MGARTTARKPSLLDAARLSCHITPVNHVPIRAIRGSALVRFVTKAEIEAEHGLEQFFFPMLKVSDIGRID
jgi:hypothetical protein